MSIICPYCNAELTAHRRTERDDGIIIDVECDGGHVATLSMPKSINEGV